MTYDDDNELKTVDGNNVSLDNDGDLLSGPLTNDTFATYVYDARNRLTNAAGVVNVYDALNNRVGQIYGTNSIEYVVNPNSKLSQVLMRIKNGVTNYYVYGLGLLYQVTESPTGTNSVTYHYDFRGSTIALSGDNGLVTDRMEYSLYATMTYRAGAIDTPFLFNGQYGVMSDQNGLLYMRARYYSPFLCRFLNPDPSGFSAGMNFYAYASGDPASMTDPTGLGAVYSAPVSSWLVSSSNAYVGQGSTPQNPADPFSISNFGANVNTPPSIMGTGVQSVPPYFTSSGDNSLAPFDPNLPATWSVSSTAPHATLDGAGAIMLAGLTIDASVVDPALLETTLPREIAATFSAGEYTTTVLEEDMTAYRYSGGGSIPAGQFLTTGDTVSQISSSVSASIALNLPARATAETLNTFIIPAGTRIFTGGVAGGADTATQIFIRDPSVLIPH